MVLDVGVILLKAYIGILDEKKPPTFRSGVCRVRGCRLFQFDSSGFKVRLDAFEQGFDLIIFV